MRTPLAGMRALIFLTFSLFASLQAQENTTQADQAAQLIRAKQYPEALKILTGDLAALSAKAPAYSEDQLMLWKARALYLNMQYAESEKTCIALTEKFPASQWLHKANFLKAHTFAARGNYQTALSIYETESTRLFSKKRKNEVANSLLGFADLFAKIPAPEDLDAPQPDFQKAYNLYKEILMKQTYETDYETDRLLTKENANTLFTWVIFDGS